MVKKTYNPYYRVKVANCDKLALFESDSVDSKVLRWLPEGTVIFSDETYLVDNEFLKIKTKDGVIGYVVDKFTKFVGI